MARHGDLRIRNERPLLGRKLLWMTLGASLICTGAPNTWFPAERSRFMNWFDVTDTTTEIKSRPVCTRPSNPRSYGPNVA